MLVTGVDLFLVQNMEHYMLFHNAIEIISIAFTELGLKTEQFPVLYMALF